MLKEMDGDVRDREFALALANEVDGKVIILALREELPEWWAITAGEKTVGLGVEAHRVFSEWKLKRLLKEQAERN